MAEFDAKAVLDQSVEKIEARLHGLTLEQLAALREGEGLGKNRSTLIATLDLVHSSKLAEAEEAERERSAKAQRDADEAAAQTAFDAKAKAAKDADAKARAEVKARELAAAADFKALQGVLRKVRAVSLRTGEGDELLRVAAGGGDFTLKRRKAVYQRAVEIGPEAPGGAIQQAVLLDAKGATIANHRWAVPLYGGGGRRCAFPVGSVAFDLEV